MNNKTTNSMITVKPSILWMAAGLMIGIAFCSAWDLPRQAGADVTETPRREAFKDGGALNEAVLKEISATLKRIEARVDRIEKNTSSPEATPLDKKK